MKTTHSPGAALVGKLCALVFALLPATAWADCAQWDASGSMNLAVQTNVSKLQIYLRLSQAGDVITGKAETFRKEQEITVNGTVNGTVKGNKFEVQIYWQYPGKHEKDEIGVYIGEIGPQGRVEGTAYIKQDPNNAARKSTWYGTKLLKCLSAAPASNTNPQPAKTKAKIPAKPLILIPDPRESSGAAPAQSGPVIVAHPQTVRVPAGQSEGTTVLVWDGGSEHPYAEVWVKAGDEDEKFVVEQGKGTRQMKVEAGKTYTYILTDSGKRLSTVTVTAE